MTSLRRRMTRPKGWRRNYDAKRKAKLEGEASNRAPTPPGSTANRACEESSIPLSPLISSVKAHLQKCRNENRRKKIINISKGIDEAVSESWKYLDVSPKSPEVPVKDSRATEIQRQDGYNVHQTSDKREGSPQAQLNEEACLIIEDLEFVLA